jgi:hypothetical protein
VCVCVCVGGGVHGFCRLQRSDILNSKKEIKMAPSKKKLPIADLDESLRIILKGMIRHTK